MNPIRPKRTLDEMQATNHQEKSSAEVSQDLVAASLAQVQHCPLPFSERNLNMPSGTLEDQDQKVKDAAQTLLGVEATDVKEDEASNTKLTLFEVAKNCQWDLVRELLQRPGCNVNASPATGVHAGLTPLWLAANKGQWNIVREMLKRPECNVNAAAATGLHAGITPLWLAANKGQWDIVREMLKRADCNVNAAATTGRHAGITPLWWIAGHAQWDIVREMLKRADCNVNTSPATGVHAGITPFWVTASHCQWDIVREMLKRPECNVNAAAATGRHAGRTPLWLAANKGQWDIVREMLKRADCNVNAAAATGRHVEKTVLGFLKDDLDVQKELVYWLFLHGASVTREALFGTEEVNEMQLAAISKMKEDLFKSLQNIVKGFFYEKRLPKDMRTFIWFQSIYIAYPESRNIPERFILRKIEAILSDIRKDHNDKAIGWFSIKAFAWCRKEKIEFSDPSYRKFSNFQRLWKECFGEYAQAHYGTLLDKPQREALLAEFKMAERPLTKNKFDQIIAATFNHGNGPVPKG